MPRKCFIPDCLSNTGKNSGYTPVFSFPKLATRRKQWMDIVRTGVKSVTADDPGPNACICIHHFDPNLIEKQPQLTSTSQGAAKYKLRLVKDAVPSILQPNKDKAGTNRRLLRKFKYKRAGASPVKAKHITRSSSVEAEAAQKLKDEHIRINTALEFLDDFGPQYYKTEWNKQYRVVKQTKDAGENPLNWSIDKVKENISKVCDNEEIASRFKEQEIDGSALLDLSKEDLNVLLNIKMGPSIKIFHFIEKLRSKVCKEFVVFGIEDSEMPQLKT